MQIRGYTTKFGRPCGLSEWSRDVPMVPERILHAALPVSIVLIHRLIDGSCAGFECAPVDRIDVIHEKPDCGRGWTELLACIGQLNHRTRDLHLRMADGSIGLIHPHDFFRIEREL